MKSAEHLQPAGPEQRRLGLKAALAGTLVVTGSLAWMAATHQSHRTGVSAETFTHSAVPADIAIDRNGPSDVDVFKLTIRPGGASPWHSHRGPVLVTVKQGTVTQYRASGTSCTRATYKPGQAFVEEPGRVHVTKNETKRDVELYVVSMLPKGANSGEFEQRPANCHH